MEWTLNRDMNLQKILGDNQGAIALSKDHFIRDALHKKKIEIIYCSTTDMIADIMIKPMTKLKLERFKRFYLDFKLFLDCALICMEIIKSINMRAYGGVKKR